MENYSSYIKVPRNIITAVNIEHEVPDYWQCYIPTEDFKKLLDTSISYFGNYTPENKSIWMQGIYGVGKSHTITVLKHLFFDDVELIKDYMEHNKDSIGPVLVEKLYKFREAHKFLPVMITGLKNISQPSELYHTIQIETRKALTKNNISLSIKDDFQTYIEMIDKNIVNWEQIISDPILNKYVTSIEQLRMKLEEGNKQILQKVIECTAKNGIFFSAKSITTWLEDLEKELRESGKADGIVIYWDEFTQFLESDNATKVIGDFQNIAELSQNHDIFLFIVTHKVIQALDTRISDKEMSKIKDRFKEVRFESAGLTTYKILSNSIKVIDNDNLVIKAFRKQYESDIDHVIEYLREINHDKNNPPQEISDLFPFHPYTAFLCTELARLFGSVNRTVVSFLNDSNLGFAKFLETHPITNQQVFLLADSLYDYFEDYFSKIHSYQHYVTHLNSNIEHVTAQGPQYAIVFKIVVLLIILKEASGNLLTAPNDRNIGIAVRGSNVFPEFARCLKYLVDNELIRKDGGGNYMITLSYLPSDDVQKKKEEYRSRYKDDPLGLLNDDNIVKAAENAMKTEDNLLRPYTIKIENGENGVTRLDRIINTHYDKNPASQLIVLYISTYLNNRVDLNEAIEKYSKDYSKDTPSIILHLTNTMSEQTFEELITLKAEIDVADDHRFPEVANDLRKQYLNKENECLQNILKGEAELTLCQTSKPYTNKLSVSELALFIQNVLFKKIYSSGFENIATCSTHTIWKTSGATTNCISEYLDLEKKSQLLSLRGHSKTASAIFDIVSETKDQANMKIVDENMEIIDIQKFHDHPLYVAKKQIEKVFENQNGNKEINLGDELRFLSKPPFGFYRANIYMCAMGYLLKNYYQEFLDEQDQPMGGNLTKNLIDNLLKYWTGMANLHDKLVIRFYTKSQVELFNKLIRLFKLNCHESRKSIRWEICDKWLNISEEEYYPIWVLKFLDDNPVKKEIIDLIQNFISNSEFPSSSYTKLNYYLKDYSHELEELFKKENLAKGLEAWLKFTFPEEDLAFKDVYNDMKKTLPERTEVNSWTEEKLTEFMKNYIYFKNKKDNGGTTGGAGTTNGGGQTSGTGQQPPSKNTIEKRRNKILEKLKDKDEFMKLITKKLEDDEFVNTLFMGLGLIDDD